MEKIRELVRSRLAESPSTEDAREGGEALEEAEGAIDAVQAEPNNPQRQQKLQQSLFNIVASDDTFAADLVRVITESQQEEPKTAPTPDSINGASRIDASTGTSLNGHPPVTSARRDRNAAPVRGFPGLTVSAASPQTTAGTDFSIFVLVQNPFDVPITIHHVQTHIPVDLADVNQWRVKVARLSIPSTGKDGTEQRIDLIKRFIQRRRLWREHPGVATAVGTEITPEEASNLFKSEITVGRNLHIESGGTFSAVSFVLPGKPTSDELDAIMRRVIDYRRGTLPVRLQPGDSVVRQFVLRTRSRIFFRPLSHSFQIQVSYSVDDEDHTGTIPYQLTIQAALGSISAGSVVGAVLGTLVRSLSHPNTASISTHPVTILQALAVSVMASIAVVIAFARKSSAQPLVSIEDFWGGLVIGFTVGYFGFQTFTGLFRSGG
jgi:hypothetical protein